jgi:hypothetical protein
MPGQDPPGGQGQASAEIRFASPSHYAIVLHAAGKLQTVYTAGDAIFHPQDATRSLTVERVEPGAIVVRAGRWGRAHTLRAGRAIPGFPGLTFIRTVMLQAVEYRYKVVDRILNTDPVLVALDGSRAILEVETLARATLDAGVLKQVRVREIDSDVYEVPAADVQPVLENVGRVLWDLAPTVRPILSLQEGLQYQITSAASDGILTAQGFLVISPKLAERAGIELGDRIMSVNGMPVDGLGSLYGIYRQVRDDPALSTVFVEIERRGTHFTKTYRIR